MEGISAVAGKDVVVIDGNVITALADGEAVKLSFGTAVGMMKVSKDGNAIYALNYSGLVVTVELRIIRGSLDDQILNSSLQQWLADPSSFSLMAGSFIKRIGDGKGNVLSEVYQLGGGIFENIPDALMNTEGTTDQSVVLYKMLFRNNVRLMQ